MTTIYTQLDEATFAVALGAEGWTPPLVQALASALEMLPGGDWQEQRDSLDSG